jgi:hypothetical protein
MSEELINSRKSLKQISDKNTDITNENVNLVVGNNLINNDTGSISTGKYKLKHKKLPKTYINIHHDPRVVKGNTYAAFVIPSSLQLEFLRLKNEEERRSRIMQNPSFLPRVAKMGLKDIKKKDLLEDHKRSDSPIYNIVEEENNQDDPYFYIDRAVSLFFIIANSKI